MEKLINQVLNNLLLEFTVTGSETYVFVDGLWHQKGELFRHSF